MIAAVCWLLLLAADAKVADAKVSFTKVFPGSSPPYVSITVDRGGAAVFKSTPDDDQPVTFQLTADETTALFAEADKVNLAQTWESGLKVARMGQKTVRYEKDGKGAEQTFNFTTDPDAQALTEWFENISETEQRFLDLERTAKYEKTGVNEALLELQTTWEKKRLVGAQQFLPLLDRITKGESYMQIARNRAAALAETFRAGTPPATPNTSK